MTDLKVFRWTGAFGVAVFVLGMIEFPLWFSGTPPAPPPISDALGHSQFLAKIRDVALTRVLLDMGIYVCIMIFLAGFRHLIRQVRPAYEWVATLVFGAGLVWWAVTLVADSLEGGAALDTLGGKADPSAVRALLEGTLLIYNGSIAFITTALFMAVAGYAILATAALPKCTGWVACAGAILCLVAVPSMYGRVLDYSGFYNAVGWGPVVVANFPPAIWFLIAGISMIRIKANEWNLKGT